MRSSWSSIARGGFIRRLIVSGMIVSGLIVSAALLLTSAAVAQTASGSDTFTPQDLVQNPALLNELGELFKKMQQGVQFPPERASSRLLPLLPSSTVFYLALPNLGEPAQQVLSIFQRERDENDALRAWWNRPDMAKFGPKIDDAIQSFCQLSQYLGNEVVITASTRPGHGEPDFLIIAEVNQGQDSQAGGQPIALKEFLGQMAARISGKPKPEIRILDPQSLAALNDAGSPEELSVLVRPDFVVASSSLASLRRFSERLEQNPNEFATTDFGGSLVAAYEGGANVVGGLDLQKILAELPKSTAENEALLGQSGFGDMKYLIWEHKTIEGSTASQMELTFTGPRRGIASWLAAPGPLGSLDFIAPDAPLAGAFRLKNPALIFDDLQDISGRSSASPLASITQMAQAMHISFRNDLLAHLTGELAFSIDVLQKPLPAWKVILKVDDPQTLDAAVNALLTNARVGDVQSEEDGVIYHVIESGTPESSAKIALAFADGYLLIGSSQSMLAGAVRMHRSGESLGKSKKFAAALPPGQSTELSGVFFEDPRAMAAMQLQRLAPKMADSLSKAQAEINPIVIAVYGEGNALREVSRNSGVDPGVMMIVAAIAIPNLIRARTAANESSAVANLRTANTAQMIYMTTYPQKGYAKDLASLGPDPNGATALTAQHAHLIDSTLGCSGSAWCEKSGYRFQVSADCKTARCADYVAVAMPVSSGTGTRSFCSTSDAVIRVKTGVLPSGPVTAAACKTWHPLQ